MPATPEERVRQAVLIWMTRDLGYPPAQIVVESSLSELPHLKNQPVEFPDRRLDIMVYNHEKPLLVIECKAAQIEEKALYQLTGYHHWTKAPFAALAGGSGVKTISFTATGLQVLDGLPRWETLLNS